MSDKNPTIRFAGEDLPTHAAWSKLEVANQALSVLENYNKRRTQLASDFTRTTEEEVRKRLGGVEIMMPAPPEKTPGLQDKVRSLLQSNSPEDVIDILQRDHGTEYDLDGLVYLAGWESYLASLGKEVDALLQNRISFDQAAELWNEAGRPCPGRPFWTKDAVEELMQTGESS